MRFGSVLVTSIVVTEMAGSSGTPSAAQVLPLSVVSKTCEYELLTEESLGTMVAVSATALLGLPARTATSTTLCLTSLPPMHVQLQPRSADTLTPRPPPT